MERALLASLAIRAGDFVASDVLIEQLWPADQPATAARTLRSYVSRLRRRLEPRARRGARDRILQHLPGGYRLAESTIAVDSRQFENLVDEAQRAVADGEPRLASIRLRAALKLWRGDPFGDLRYEPFAAREAERLEERRAAAIELLAESEMILGQPAAVVELLRQLVARDPLRERAWRLLVEILHRAGRRAEALEEFEKARAVLAAELDVEPGEELQTLARAVRDDLLPPLARQRPAAALPRPLTPLIGRQAELRQLLVASKRSGLVTLLGPAGCGKTRLALEVARQRQAEAGPGSVAWVDLLPVSDRTGVLPVVAQSVGTPESAAADDELAGLVAAMSTEPPLLVLDNCEHLLAACAVVAARLLERCPGLTIMTTSREPLGVPGEQAFPVGPLPLPAEAASSVEAVVTSPAVELLVSRAAAARPAFRLDESNAEDLAAIARRLDGLPLAIELAAVRLRSLGPGDLLSRLEDRFRLLDGGRSGQPAHHHTLRAAIAWSYELLSGPEQVVLSRLSVFPASFGLAEAEAVCAADPIGRADVAGLMARLVDRSMVQAEGSRVMRYRLLETVRVFAAQEILDGKSRAELRRRHRDAYLALAERTERMLQGPRLESALRTLDGELPNLRAALRWSVETPGEARAGLRLATRLGWYWLKRGLLREGLDWIDEGLRAAFDADELDRAQADVAGSWLQMTDDRALAAVVHRAERAAGVAGRAGHQALEGWALVAAALAGARLGSIAPARRQAARALSLLEAAGDVEGTAAAQAALGMAAKHQARADEARRLFRAALAGFETLGDPWDAGWALVNLSDVEIQAGDAAAAISLAHEALSHFRGSSDGRSIATARIMLADAHLLGGDLLSAEEAYAGALRIAERRLLPALGARARIGLAEVALGRGDRGAAAGHAARLDADYGELAAEIARQRQTLLQRHLSGRPLEAKRAVDGSPSR